MLKLKSLIAPTTMLAAFTLTASPSFAQERSHGREKPSGQESSGRSTERAQPRSDAPRSRGAAPRVETRQEAPRAQQPRAVETPRADTRRAESRQGDNRSQGHEAESRHNDSRGYDNRGYDNRGHDNRQGGYAPHYEPRYAPRYSPYVYAPRSYYRPYVFRPRFSIGFGIFAGYPVPYAYSYGYPIVVYGYRAPRERVMVAPGSSYYGGVALEMTPYDADVFVDGQYAGKVQDFDGTTQPLTLAAGAHQIEVRAPGFETMMVNVEIQAGQVIPYRGDLRRF